MSNNDDGNGHRVVGYVKTYDESRLRNLRIQLQDYLFDKGHTINKLMIDDLSIFVYDLNESHYAQGQITTTTATDGGSLTYVSANTKPESELAP